MGGAGLREKKQHVQYVSPSKATQQVFLWTTIQRKTQYTKRKNTPPTESSIGPILVLLLGKHWENKTQNIKGLLLSLVQTENFPSAEISVVN